MESYLFPKTVASANFTISRRNPLGTFNPDVKSDLVINVNGIQFSLHKFVLVSRSGRIRRMVEEAEAELVEHGEDSASPSLLLEFSDFPGGADTFELAAKFCYGINFEITAANVAHLRCAAEHLEMTDAYGGESNLLSRTEVYMREAVMESLDKCAEVLKSCERVMQAAEEVKLVNRCIDAIASQVCREDRVKEHIISAFTSTGRGQGTPRAGGGGGRQANAGSMKAVVEWWADTIAPLRIDVFTRLASAMKCRGIRSESLGGALIHYAERNLLNPLAKRGAYDPKPKVKLTLDGVASTKAAEHEQRILLESIVSLLPDRTNVPGGGSGHSTHTKSVIFPTKFLLALLRAAVQLDTTVACRMELERRVACQLESAAVSDLLIPASGDMSKPTLFDVDVVQRVVEAYLQRRNGGDAGDVYVADEVSTHGSEDFAGGSPNREVPRGVGRVAKLVDAYLAEVASDANLKASKFIGLAELVPEHARVSDDALYRAIDIYLKAHPMLSDMERKKMCKLLDCQKLSQEACTHAAQNERLPVQMVVQVLYFEQMRMRNAMVTTATTDHNNHHQQPQGYHQQQLLYSLSGNSATFNTSKPPSLPAPPTQPQNNIINNIDPYSSLRRDNRELKLEVARLRLRVNDLEQENSTLKHNLEQLHNNNHHVPPSTPSFLSFLSRRFGRFNSLFSPSSSSYRSSKEASNSDTTNSKAIPRRRRHSIS